MWNWFIKRYLCLLGRRCKFGRVASGDRETARGVRPSSASTTIPLRPPTCRRRPRDASRTDSGGGFPDAFRSWQSPFERSWSAASVSPARIKGTPEWQCGIELRSLDIKLPSRKFQEIVSSTRRARPETHEDEGEGEGKRIEFPRRKILTKYQISIFSISWKTAVNKLFTATISALRIAEQGQGKRKFKY